MQTIRTIWMLSLPILIAGCATTSPSSDVTSDDTASNGELALNPFDRIDARPDILLTGRAEGNLRSTGTCIVLQTERGILTPLWPEGTTVRTDSGRPTVVLPDGRGAAALGAPAVLTGGAFATTDEPQIERRLREACPTPFYSVSIAAGADR